MGFKVDDSQRPVLVVTWQGETTVDDVDRYGAWCDAELERARRDGSRFAIVSDATAVTFVGSEARQALTARSHRLTRDVVIGHYVVTPDGPTVARGITSAVRWMNPRITAVYTAKSVEQAVERARAALAS